MAQDRDADIRISGAERDEAVALLGEHMSTGRLEVEEYEFRCVRAVAARTRGDIELLFTDLPAPHPDLSAAVRPNPSELIKRAVTKPVAKRGLTQTPASAALDAFTGLFVLFGLPGSILLTIYFGLWWTIVLTVGVVVVAGSAAEAAKKKQS
ncbi:DUF1707 SHOCT-like domain-containing protein [Actinokineospora enzanensis]|uniref:DUF1707 SHOCT-like domain-containing protein n=1 Tax=Actinokineospora enzanensis TaxID=155975 RepID=UPI00037D3093|nr:DUF1707 domain-containing protein [Actinokineospora enzanensis]